MKYIHIVLILLNTFIGAAQKEANNWYFGYGFSLDFNSGKAKYIARSTMPTRFGCGAISNTKGRTLFYSNGLNLYDSSHNVIPNYNFTSYYTSSQPVLFVPWPDSTHKYILFTPPEYKDSCLKYSIINCNLRKGLGDIEKGKFNLRLPSFPLGKINAVRHANRHDYWILVPQVKTDSVHAYLITNKGIQLPPIRSKIGVIFKSKNFTDNFGYLKFSPDGKKVGLVSMGDSSFIADFDASSGQVSNPWWFYSAGSFCIEYSNTGKYLYMLQFGYHLVQYELESKTRDGFLTSRKIVDSLNYRFYGQSGLQLASDGKIYIFPDPRSSNNPNYAFLNVIHSPDSAGKMARLEQNYLDLGYLQSTNSAGLPDFIQSYFNKPSFRVRQNCTKDTVFFTVKDVYELDSVNWDFGDTSSGVLNYSVLTQNVFHHYKKLGFYKVRLISFHKTYSDTIYETFILKPVKPDLGKDTNFCKSKAISLSPKEEYPGYKWSTKQITKSIYVTNPGTYIVTVSEYDGCTGSDTIVVNKPIVKADFTTIDSNHCMRSNYFKLNETTSYQNGVRQYGKWYMKDSLISNNTLTTLSFKSVGSYLIKLVCESYGGCRDSITKKLIVYPNTKVNFSVNDSLQCYNQHSFDFKINKDTGNLSYLWDLGDINITTGKDVIAKRYVKTGKYNISLIAVTDKNCRDTLTKTINLLPNPKADFTYDLACSRTLTKFQFTGSKLPSPITTILKWNFNNEATSIIENPTHQFAAAGTSTTSLILASDNGCADTLIKIIDIKPQSKADFTTEDVCESDSAVFKNLSQDATGYNWKFGDGQTSKSQSAKGETKHKFQISTTTTFNVTLVALVQDGCADSIVKAVTVNESPNSDFTSTQLGNKLNLKANAGYTQYQWKIENTDSFTTPNSNYTYTLKNYMPHKVCLTVTDGIGCTALTCKTITLGISKILNPGGFKIYPNPNTGNFTIEIDNPEKDGTIEVYNTVGKLVKKVERVEKVNSIQLNPDEKLDSLIANGIYLVRVKNGKVVWNQKVLVSFDGDISP